MSPQPEFITIRELIAFGTLIGVIMAIISFVITTLANAYKMKKKYMPKPPDGNGYRLKSEASRCMEERKKAEGQIIKVLRRMEKRLIVGNLVMRDLVEADDKIANDKIKKYEEDMGIDLQNRDFGIPET